MRTLIYLSTCATDAKGVPCAFLHHELGWLTEHFDRVLLCGHAGVGWAQAGQAAIPLAKPLWPRLRAALGAPFSRDVWREWAHLRRDGKLTPVHALKVLVFAIRGRTLAGWARPALRAGGAVTVYAFWMSYDAYAAALIKARHPGVRAVARGHAFEIDLARNPMNPYLMKAKIGEELDGIFPISGDAQARLLACAPMPAGKVRVLPLGSAGDGIPERWPAPRFAQGALHVVSCASIHRIKQVPVLIDALARWQGGRLEWLHIGGGVDEAAVRAYAAAKLGGRADIQYRITGAITADQVLDFYAKQPFDVFVNTSSSEGVPVSIMEALRAGLPIIAPAVGGIPELVDDAVGILYAPEGGADAVRQALEQIAAQTPEQAQAMRQAAQTRWAERCRNAALLAQLFPEAQG
ncbi:MAG: glycosyltransferase [Candidatus Limiplasma sp.]|nr:glycosyltransferase [Candidatus Limiplasma sp.]